MPRHGNTFTRKAFHHKSMSSPAHGKGHDAKRRLAKQQNGTKAKPARANRPNRRQREEE